ncbi:MAG: hypothetical protein N2109_01570 [Fimbriimonadales bacterium]|nr:hypothetical protein [Fimbriimonadales bacterium]
MTRIGWLGCLWGVATAAHGQLAGQAMMEAALRNLARQGSVSIRLAGTEEFDGRQRSFAVRCWFEANPGSQVGPRLECREVNAVGEVVRRYVADGRTLWLYEPGLRRYAAWNYGGHAAAPSEGAVRRLLSAFRSQSGGPTGWVARLLAETWGADQPRWTAWIPFASSTVEPGRITLRSPDNLRGAVFFLDGQGDDIRLSGLRWAQEETLRGRLRRVQWEAEILPSTDSPADAFLFGSPPGSSPIAWPRRSGS